eukprot:GHRQ01013503.1.p1 GENE.GHRQ01013503.1~~GHRQ01013503.1.p1  ORF type:complete len:134 (-),score=32.18 GHRQ01013503.1:551-952(-)
MSNAEVLLPATLCSAKLMHEHVNPKNGDAAPLISDEVYEIIVKVCADASCAAILALYVLAAVVSLLLLPRQYRQQPVASFNYNPSSCMPPSQILLAVSSLLLPLLQNLDRLDSEIIYDRDFDYDYFGFKVSCR